MTRPMRTLALNLVLLAVCLPAARAASPVDIGQKLAAQLQDLPPDQIPSGILYDRVLDLSHLEAHDGSAVAAPISLRGWQQGYDEMVRGNGLPRCGKNLESWVCRGGIDLRRGVRRGG